MDVLRPSQSPLTETDPLVRERTRNNRVLSLGSSTLVRVGDQAIWLALHFLMISMVNHGTAMPLGSIREIALKVGLCSFIEAIVVMDMPGHMYRDSSWEPHFDGPSTLLALCAAALAEDARTSRPVWRCR